MRFPSFLGFGIVRPYITALLPDTGDYSHASGYSFYFSPSCEFVKKQCHFL
jgi:hypothetical protein